MPTATMLGRLFFFFFFLVVAVAASPLMAAPTRHTHRRHAHLHFRVAPYTYSGPASPVPDARLGSRAGSRLF